MDWIIYGRDHRGDDFLRRDFHCRDVRALLLFLCAVWPSTPSHSDGGACGYHNTAMGSDDYTPNSLEHTQAEHYTPEAQHISVRRESQKFVR